MHRELNRQVKIRSDGLISLPLVGDVKANGLTTDQLKKKLTGLYRRFVLAPKLTIYLTRFNVKIDELKRAITTAARGQSKIVPVRPDGRISLPIIGDVQAAGLTVQELRRDIMLKYTRLVRNLDVTVIVKQLTAPQVFVQGEVRTPGAFNITGPTPLSRVLSLARGVAPTGDPKNVLILRRYRANKPMALRINYGKLLQGDVTKDILLVRNDVVYVPPKNRRRVFVFGEVKFPAIVPYDETITISQAIAGARGFTIRAKRSSVLVIRHRPGKKPRAFRVDMAALIKRGDVTKEIFLKSGDTVYVPRSFIAVVGDFINQWFTRGLYALFPADSMLDFVVDVDSLMHLHRRSYAF